MDLICVILWVIDLFKPSIGLSIAVIATGLIDLFLLLYKQRDFNIAYVTSIAGLIIGTYTICIL